MVLYVCTGNTCRSYMAQRIHMAQFGDNTAASAGLAANPGQPASAYAVQALQQLGIQPGDHAAQPVTPQLIEQADRVLAMTAGHLMVLQQQYPQHAGKMALLSQAAGTVGDVQDPFCGSLQDYLACAKQLTQLIGRLTP